MSELLIKNGFVVDPASGINGERKDIAIRDGVIVEEVSNRARVIDATGKTVMSGGVDIHSHIAGPKVNAGRTMRPEDKLFKSHARQGLNRVEMGFSIPSTFKTGYDYARMGYAFVMEAAMPPIHAAHVHEEIHDTPIIDEAALPVFGNNWFVLEYLKNHQIENTAAYIAWILQQSKGYGVKCVNPGGSEAWGWGLNCLRMNDPVPYFNITPAEIVKGLIEANEYLGLPHSVHLHTNNLGNPGNYTTTIESLKIAEGMKTDNKFKREQVLHHTHVQFHSYGGDSWLNFESKAREVMDYVNSAKNLTIDLGCVTLDETTTMTADGPFEHHLTELNHLKWTNVDVELETSAGVVPYVYSPNIKVCGIQWAIGLELALFAKDMSRTFITTDHPNAGPFIRYPRIIKWLMSEKARKQQIDAFKYSQKVIDATNLASMDRELSLYEIAEMTRSGPARALGLFDMYGGLLPGMDGNVAIYDLNPNDMPEDPEKIEQAFSMADHFIKSGVVILENGMVIDQGHKRTLWVNAKTPLPRQVLRDIEEKFLKNYTVSLSNYQVKDYLVPNPHVIEVESHAA